jgi:hypothetical protein
MPGAWPAGAVIGRAIRRPQDVYSGTHTGDLAGPGGTIPVSGRTFSLPYVDIL